MLTLVFHTPSLMPKAANDTSGEITLATDRAAQDLTDSERLFHELNLLRLEGYVFDFAKKHGTNRFSLQTFSEDLKLPNGTVIKNAVITIDPHQRHGKPQDVAYK